MKVLDISSTYHPMAKWPVLRISSWRCIWIKHNKRIRRVCIRAFAVQGTDWRDLHIWNTLCIWLCQLIAKHRILVSPWYWEKDCRRKVFWYDLMSQEWATWTKHTKQLFLLCTSGIMLSFFRASITDERGSKSGMMADWRKSWIWGHWRSVQEMYWKLECCHVQWSSSPSRRSASSAFLVNLVFLLFIRFSPCASQICTSR